MAGNLGAGAYHCGLQRDLAVLMGGVAVRIDARVRANHRALADGDAAAVVQQSVLANNRALDPPSYRFRAWFCCYRP